MTHPSFGPVPPEEFAKAEKAPFGQATRIIQKYDPLFGTGNRPTKHFQFTVRQRVYRTDTATVVIEAHDQEQAETLLDSRDWEDFSWEEGWDEDADDHSIDEVIELKKGQP